MANQVEKVNYTTAITTTPTEILDLQDKTFNTIHVQNTTGETVTIEFGNGADYDILDGDKILQPFLCKGKVKVSVASGSTSTGSLFFQATVG